MTQRFLEIEISRHIYTSVIVAIDDEDSKYAGLFDANDKITTKGWSSLKEVAHKAADKIVSEYDWETDNSETEINGYQEVFETESKQFKVWNEKNNQEIA